VLLEYNADEKLFPASVTKIMTMLLTVEAIKDKKISLTDVVVCSENASKKGGSQIWLEPNEEMTVNDLLKATAIGSANDAATLLGEYISGSEEAFVALMNTRAKELKMNNTHFENATGLDDTTDTHLTTARDIALMSVELMKYDLIQDYTTVWMDSLRNGETELVNTNKLVRFYNGTTGIKTGTTAKAGCCVSASAKRDDLHLVAVVMGSVNSNERFESAKALLNWGFANYEKRTLEIDESVFCKVPVIGGESETVVPYIQGTTEILLKKGEFEKLEQIVDLAEDLEAPVAENQKIGSVRFMLSGKCVEEFSVLAQEEVKKLTFYTSFLRMMQFLSSGETNIKKIT
jgi:D-alanyl-D-alanine carboxypeptidase (penicillin-binding protein 5/6)